MGRENSHSRQEERYGKDLEVGKRSIWKRWRILLFGWLGPMERRDGRPDEKSQEKEESGEGTQDQNWEP